MDRDPAPLSDADLVGSRLAGTGSGRQAPSFDGARISAVLVGLVEGRAGTEVVLTRRAAHLRHHRGEISFPGGRSDPGETPVETALREAEEEIGLAPESVEVLGELDHVATVVSSSYIVPIVARVDPPRDFCLNPGEVDRVLRVPLVELVRADTYRSEWWQSPVGEFEVHFFELDDETIWGATGRMLHGLLARVLDL